MWCREIRLANAVFSFLRTIVRILALRKHACTFCHFSPAHWRTSFQLFTLMTSTRTVLCMSIWRMMKIFERCLYFQPYDLELYLLLWVDKNSFKSISSIVSSPIYIGHEGTLFELLLPVLQKLIFLDPKEEWIWRYLFTSPIFFYIIIIWIFAFTLFSPVTQPILSGDK